MNATTLAAYYKGKGIVCEIEAGARGITVYASTRVDASRVAIEIANAIRTRDPKVYVTAAAHDTNEPTTTAWWCAIDFDWRRF